MWKIVDNFKIFKPKKIITPQNRYKNIQQSKTLINNENYTKNAYLIYNLGMEKTEKCILTNICLVYDKDRILVIDRKKKDWPGLTFPGGHVEKNEDFNKSVIREVKEETGLTIRKPILCGIEEFKTKDEDRYLMLYYKTDKFSGKIRSSKEGEVFWINKNDLDKYKLSLDLKRIYKVMTSDELSEIIYYEKDGRWLSKTV